MSTKEHWQLYKYHIFKVSVVSDNYNTKSTLVYYNAIHDRSTVPYLSYFTMIQSQLTSSNLAHPYPQTSKIFRIPLDSRPSDESFNFAKPKSESKLKMVWKIPLLI